MACEQTINTIILEKSGFPDDYCFEKHNISKDGRLYYTNVIIPPNYHFQEDFDIISGSLIATKNNLKDKLRIIRLFNDNTETITHYLEFSRISQIAEKNQLNCMSIFIGSYKTKEHTYFVFKYEQQLNLSELILNNMTHFSENPDILIYLMYLVAKAIFNLINCVPNFITRLTLYNVCVQSDYQIRIEPFSDISESSIYISSKSYQPPEVLIGHNNDDTSMYEKRMVWMYGHLFASVFTRRPCIQGVDTINLLRKLTDNFGVPSEFLKLSPNIAQFIIDEEGEIPDGKPIHQVFPQIESKDVFYLLGRTFKFNDYERPTFKEILNMPLFSTFV